MVHYFSCNLVFGWMDFDQLTVFQFVVHLIELKMQENCINFKNPKMFFCLWLHVYSSWSKVFPVKICNMAGIWRNAFRVSVAKSKNNIRNGWEKDRWRKLFIPKSISRFLLNFSKAPSITLRFWSVSYLLKFITDVSDNQVPISTFCLNVLLY